MALLKFGAKVRNIAAFRARDSDVGCIIMGGNGEFRRSRRHEKASFNEDRASKCEIKESCIVQG